MDTKNTWQLPLDQLNPESYPELFTKIGVKSYRIDIGWVEKIGFWSIVWSQLKKDKLAILGLWCIAILIGVATFAPCMALDKPFFCYTPENGMYLPWFKSLFDRNVFENGVDIFFNLLMVLSPLYFLAFQFLRKRLGRRFSLYFVKVVTGFLAAHLCAFLLVDLGLQYGLPAKYYIDIQEKIVARQMDASSTTKIYYLYPIRPFSPRQADITEINPRHPSAQYWLGTDKDGYDVLTLMVYGTRISLTIGIIAVSIYIAIGIILGAAAGYFGGKTDMLISRFIEIMICFPTFFLVLTLAAFVYRPTIFHIMLIIGVTGWTGVARLVRAEFLRLRNTDYVQAAIALGLSQTRVIFGHVLPNALGPVLVSATFGVAGSILTESALSFLGLGDPTMPSWGMVLSNGRICGKLWLILIPGLAIFFVVSVFNLVGGGLRDALDPKLRH